MDSAGTIERQRLLSLLVFILTKVLCVVTEGEYVVGFTEVSYTVTEGQSRDICVHLITPVGDIGDTIIYLEVVVVDEYLNNLTNGIARPDSFSFFGSYNMDKLADYPPPIKGQSGQIHESPITNSTRVICYNQYTYDDNRFERTEKVYLGLIATGVNDTEITVTIDPEYGHTVLHILDNNGKDLYYSTLSLITLEVFMPEFEFPSYTTNENDGPVVTCINVEPGLLERVITIWYRTMDCDGVGAQDYNIQILPLKITPDTTQLCPIVPIINDDSEEGNEQFIVELVVQNYITHRITVTIIDDDVVPSPTSLTAASVCLPLDDPTNGSVTLCGLQPGGRAAYSCNYGYELDGQDVLTCLTNGEWNNPPPTCHNINGPSTSPTPNPSVCPLLEVPQNGSLKLSGRLPGDTAIYSCNSELKIDGTDILTCLLNGTWNYSPPTCAITDVISRPSNSPPLKTNVCPALDVPQNGSLMLSGLMPGDTATYSCNSGFEIDGQDVLICWTNGEWDGPPPTCHIIDASSSTSDIHRGSIICPPVMTLLCLTLSF